MEQSGEIGQRVQNDGREKFTGNIQHSKLNAQCNTKAEGSTDQRAWSTPGSKIVG